MLSCCLSFHIFSQPVETCASFDVLVYARKKKRSLFTNCDDVFSVFHNQDMKSRTSHTNGSFIKVILRNRR